MKTQYKELLRSDDLLTVWGEEDLLPEELDDFTVREHLLRLVENDKIWQCECYTYRSVWSGECSWCGEE